MRNVERVPKEVRVALESEYNQLMKKHEEVLQTAYPVGLKFQKTYIESPSDISAKWIITRTEFRCCDYGVLTWSSRRSLYTFDIYFKKLDSRGRPNGKEHVIDRGRFDAGMLVRGV